MKTKLILLASATILFYTSSAEPISLHSVTNGESAAAYFAQFPYAGTNIASFSEFDFEGRRKDIVNILDQEILVASSNVLFAVAAYLSQGTPIPTENYRSEILAAHKQDRFFELGDSNHVVRAGSAYFGPRARACRQQYEYRRSYNYDLCDFRRAVLKEIYMHLIMPPWTTRPLTERNALWLEIKRSVNPTQDEIKDIPETLDEN